MDLSTVLSTAERRANNGLLMVIWIMTILASVASYLVFGANMLKWIGTQVFLMLIPTVFHLLRRWERGVKFLVAIVVPLSMLALCLFYKYTQVMWPLWFIGLGIGAYYMDRGVAVLSAITNLGGALTTILLFPPDLTEKATKDLFFVGVLGLLAVASMVVRASFRFRNIMRSLDQAASLERVSKDLQAAMQTLSAGASAVREVVGELEEESAKADRALTRTVAPAVQAILEGTRDQERSLAMGAESLATITASVDQLAAGAEQQAEQTSQSMAVVTAVAESAAAMVELVNSVSEDAQLASRMATEGGQLVELSKAAAEGVQATVEETAARLSELGERSEKIGQVVVLIQEIANQTSLLALNAAIEAARAGEQGRGFAVVADEVRKLADRSSGATREISGLIGEVAGGIESSLAAMAQTRGSVAESASQSGRTAEMLTGILDATGRTANRMSEIQARMAEMNEAAGRLSDRMAQLAALAEENSASAEEMRSAAHQMSLVAGELQNVGRQSSAAMSNVEAAISDLGAVIAALTDTTRRLATMSDQLENR